jgi:hypothetical protein
MNLLLSLEIFPQNRHQMEASKTKHLSDEDAHIMHIIFVSGIDLCKKTSVHHYYRSKYPCSMLLDCDSFYGYGPVKS